MANPTEIKKATLARVKRTEAYAERVRQLFAATVNEILALKKTLPTLGEGEMFSFDAESIRIQRQVEALLRKLSAASTLAIQKGIQLEWAAANDAADSLIETQFGKQILESTMFSSWRERNTRAMNAFIRRSDNGLNLSQRVWKSVEQLRDEMEVAITVSVGEGDSAQSMSRKVRQYLNDPDLMFRRFRYKAGEVEIKDEEGNVIGTKPVYGLKWKKKVKKADGTVGWIDYDKSSYQDKYTGKGYYKSSAQNAMRVARTETNIAYRRADNERMSQLDFVLGQRVQLSHSHPKKDICDKLQGDYPKDFVFDGWHPQCFCFVTPILVDAEEMAKVNEAFLQGKKYIPKGKRITDYPEGFKSWVTDNADKLAEAHANGTDPYFTRNNWDTMQKIMNGEDFTETAPAQPTLLEKAAARHAARTEEQKKDILDRWKKRNEEIEQIKTSAADILSEAKDYAEIDFSELESIVSAGNISKMKAASVALQQKIDEMKKQEAALEDVLFDVHKWHKQFTIAELKLAQNAVKNTEKLKGYPDADIDKMSLAELQGYKNMLESEAQWKKNHPKYKTDAVVEQAYREKAKLVEDEIKWRDIKQQHKDYMLKLSASFPHLTQELTAAINAKDFAAATVAVNRLRQWDNVITQRTQFASALGSMNADMLKSVDDAIRKKDVTAANKELSKLASWQAVLTKRAELVSNIGTGYSTLFSELDDAIRKNKPIVAKKAVDTLDRWVKVIQMFNAAQTVKQTDELKKLIAKLKKLIASKKIDDAEQIAAEIQKLTMSPAELYCQQNYTEKFTVNSQKSYDDVMQEMGRQSQPVWQAATHDEKQAFVDYCGSYSKQMLSDIARGRKNMRVDRIDKIMKQIHYPKDIVLRSGQDFCMAEYIFNADFRSLLEGGMIDELNAKYAGLIGKNVAYMSTSFNERGGFSKQFEFHLYCPKGTSMMNVYVLSPFGGGERTSWDGASYPPTWYDTGETEIFLGRDLYYKFVRAEAGTGKGGTTRVYVQVLGVTK